MNLIPKKIWFKTLVRPNSKIEDVARSLSRSSLQICLVVSANKTLIGTITDGDIRRALLRGLTLKSSINTLIKKNPFVVTSQMDRKTIKYLMESKSLLQAPQVDEKFKVVGFHLWKDFTKGKHLWVRNNLSTIFSQMVDTASVLFLLCLASDFGWSTGLAWSNFPQLFHSQFSFK